MAIIFDFDFYFFNTMVSNYFKYFKEMLEIKQSIQENVKNSYKQKSFVFSRRKFAYKTRYCSKIYLINKFLF